VLAAARLTTDNPWLHRRAVDQALEVLRQADNETSPAELLSEALRGAFKVLGDRDPFSSQRGALKRQLRSLRPRLEQAIERAADPLEAALRAATAANLVDSLALRSLDLEDSILERFERGFARADLRRFREQLARYDSVVFIHDNAGEAELDTLLIERLEGLGKVVRRVAREPGLLHDATLADAPGGSSTGAAIMGAPRPLCHAPFDSLMQEQSLVIAKGAACYETLATGSGPLVFLLAAKCEPIAAELGVSVEESVMIFADERSVIV
jgi:damage-control phosphatase, subfamily I